MSISEDLYREIILDHFKSPRNQGKLESPALQVQGANPLCGDELNLFLLTKNETIVEVKIQTRGCSISQASASMMSEVIKGHRFEVVEKLIGAFKALLLSDESLPEDIDTGDLEALAGVKNYPVRIKCALLPWNTLLEGLRAIKEHKPAEAVVME